MKKATRMGRLVIVRSTLRRLKPKAGAQRHSVDISLIRETRHGTLKLTTGVVDADEKRVREIVFRANTIVETGHVHRHRCALDRRLDVAGNP